MHRPSTTPPSRPRRARGVAPSRLFLRIPIVALLAQACAPAATRAPAAAPATSHVAMPSVRHGAKAHRWGTGVALAIPLWVDSVPGMQGWSPELVALAYAAAAEWSAPDVPVRFVRANGSDGALVRVHWHWDAPWPGRGVTRRTVDVRGETTGADCWIALSAQPATPHAVRVAVLHELGHALGLPHDPAPRSVMYDGHRIGADPAALTSRDRAALRALYGPRAGAVESLASGASVPTGSPRR